MAETARIQMDAPVRAMPPATRLSLRIKGEPPPHAIAGLRLDQPINRFSTADGRHAARLGPNEWLILGAPGDEEKLCAALADALGDRFHALVDVSQASLAFAVEGPDAEAILNAGCPLDLDLRACPVGFATRSILGKCEVIVLRESEHAFRVECWRSFGEYVRAFLLEAAALNCPR
jgi:sarcosine oxidase, subunit gamma